MNLLMMFEKLITEHGSSTIQKERLVLMYEQLKDLQEKNKKLEEENKLLKVINKELHLKLKEKVIPNNYEEYRGVLIRQDLDERTEPDAYCPNCKIVMTSFQGLMPFKCSKCGLKVDINGTDLKKAIGNKL